MEPPKTPIRDPISPCDCRHLRTLFVQSERSSPPVHHEDIAVCQSCGSFLILIQHDGYSVRCSFTLPTWELVEAAGQYARFLERESSEDK